MEKICFKLTKINDEVAQLDFIVGGVNLMEFIQNGDLRVVTWDYDDLVTYFLLHLKDIMIEDKFPFDVIGSTAAEMDNNFDFDDESVSENELFSIHEKLFNWRQIHSWLHASGGAIFPDVFFRRVKDKIEISWLTGSLYDEENVSFINDCGKYYCELIEFESAVKRFIQDYKKLHIK